MYSKVAVHYENNIKVVEMSHEDNVLSSLIKNEIPISHSCGGNGTCGTCQITILKNAEGVLNPNELETEMIQDRKFSRNERLSCQILPVAGLEIRIPKSIE